MTPHAAASSLPTLLIHWVADWEASLAIWENNVISGWAELLNPLWDYSLLSASVITDHRREKETNVFPLLYASIFILASSVWRELFSISVLRIATLSSTPLPYCRCLLRGSVLKSERIRFTLPCVRVGSFAIKTFARNVAANPERHKRASVWSELCSYHCTWYEHSFSYYYY